MKIKLIPDIRDEEKITEIKHVFENSEDDVARKEYIDEKTREDKEWLDAMYYAINDLEGFFIEDWEEYLLYRLMKVENYYFAADIGDYDY